MSTQRSGSEAATRVTSRRPCPVSASAASSPSASRAATSEAATCGTCETSATAESWASASSSTATAPQRPIRARTRANERSSAPAADTAHGRPWNRSARAAPGPDRSRPAIGWVPTKCGAGPTVAATSRSTPCLTAAVSTTVAATLPASSPLTTSAVADGLTATIARSTCAPGGSTVPAPSWAACRAAVGSRSVRCTRTSCARRARAIDVPIRPVPTTRQDRRCGSLTGRGPGAGRRRPAGRRAGRRPWSSPSRRAPSRG